MTDRTELRRLLDEATPRPWEATTSEATMNDLGGWRIGHPQRPRVFFAAMRTADAQLIAAAVNALPDLLDALDAAEDALNDAILYESEARDALARQTPVLLAAEARLKAVLTAARTATPTNGHAWAEGHREAVEQILDSWPEPACLLHDVSGEDVRGWEMAECTCPTRPLTAAGIIPLPMGLCGNREDHEPHLVPYAPVANGPMWCTADQSKREPYASERRRDEAGTGGAEPS